MLKVLINTFFEEMSNWLLWLVVFFAIGVGLYFSLDKEPDLHLVSLISLSAFVCTIFFRKNKKIWAILLSIFFFSAGITTASWRTHNLWAEKLTAKATDVRVYGVVEKIFLAEGKAAKLLLNVKRIYSKEKISVNKLQVTTTNFNSEIKVGDFIAFYAALSPPFKQMSPDGYDFARHAYFNQVGGSAFSISKMKIIEAARDDSISTKIENLRLSIFRILTKELGQVNGSVAAALMIGEQRSVTQNILDDMRWSGLSHILSVSGLHLSLVSIMCFFVIRRLLSFSLYISQQYNTKKIAAWISLIISFGYLLISGLQIAAVRSFLMLATLIVGVLIDRQDNSKRSVFLAALLILFFIPESLFHPSFQMSFSAVLALVGTYEIYSKRILAGQGGHRSIFKSIKFYFLGVLVSSFIAGTATSIFVMYHFHNYSNYSVLSNLLAAPVVSFIIMPGVILTFLLMPLPFGICKLGLYPLNFGIILMLKIAKYITALPKAVLILPPTHIAIPVLFTAGLLWLCIWEKKWRAFGLGPIIASFVIILITPFPDIIVDEKYKAVLLRDESGDGTLMQISGPKRASKFYKTQWIDLLHTNRQNVMRTALGESKVIKGMYRITPNLQSFPNMCIKKRDSQEIDNLAITNLKTNNVTIVSRKDVEQYGTHFIYLFKDGIKTKRTLDKKKSRPWT